MFGNFISKVLKLITMTKIDMISILYIFFLIIYQYLNRTFKLEKKNHKNNKNILKRFYKSNHYLIRIFNFKMK